MRLGKRTEENLSSGPILDDTHGDLQLKKKHGNDTNKKTKFGSFQPINQLGSKSNYISGSNDDIFESAAMTKRPQRPIDPQKLYDPAGETKKVAVLIQKRRMDISSDVASLSSAASTKSSPRRNRLDVPFLTVKEGEEAAVNRLLHPDNDVEAEGIVKRSVNITENTIEIESVRLADKVICSNDCRRIELVIEEENFSRLDFFDPFDKPKQSVPIHSSIVDYVCIFARPLTEPCQQYVDFCFLDLPSKLIELQYPGDLQRPILRLVLLSPSITLECALRRIYARVMLHETWKDYTPSFATNRPSSVFSSRYSLERRVSPRMVGRSLYSDGSESSQSSRTNGLFLATRRSDRRVSSPLLSDTNQPVLPDRAVPLFVYPESGVGAVTITTADVPRLESGVFLNDSLVDFDLRFMYENLDQQLQNRIHIFSSFFYKRLGAKGQPGVRKWTEGVDIFFKDYLIVPICEHLHWYLTIICHPYRIFDQLSASKSANDPVESEENEQTMCFILVFDSLGRPRPGTLARLKSYLVDEAKDKLGKEAARDRSQGIMVKCPRQENHTDCGLFCGQFVEAFLKDPDSIVALVKQNRLVNWFPAEEAQNRRQRLRELIATIASTSTYQHPVEPAHSSDIEEIMCLE